MPIVPNIWLGKLQINKAINIPTSPIKVLSIISLSLNVTTPNNYVLKM